MLYTDNMETTQLDSQTLQNLLNGTSDGGGVNLIPESLTGILTTSLMVSLGLMVVFLVLYALSIVRKWKVQSAILRMQKDVVEIKQALVNPEASKSTSLPQEPRRVEVITDK